MCQRLFQRNLHFCTENSVNTAMIYCFSLSCIQIFSENPCFADGKSKLFNGLGKTGTHFSGSFSLFHRNSGCFQKFFQVQKFLQVFFLCSFVCKSGCQKFCIRKIPFDFVSNILPGCVYIVDNSTLNISLKSLGVGISSDREQRIIYL